jgi:hypothetical protein
MVGWHDPNFGVRFDEIMTTIEAAVPPYRIDFLAESSLSLLSEPHLRRLRHSGFKAVLPGDRVLVFARRQGEDRKPHGP